VLAGVEDLLIEEGYFYLTWQAIGASKDLIEEYPLMLLDRSVEGSL